MTNLIVGTSGHIDHGKTTLLHALTGIQLDRSPEEKSRGITIDLGFTNMTLPSGRSLSFIDVPGHEKLVRTMISGASGMDAVLLCISAIEGVMPQTKEHMAILELLGISQGVIALTMTDLVDADLCELALMDIEESIEGTVFQNFPIVHTAAGPNPVGMEDLISALDSLPKLAKDTSQPFRLPIDRVFIQSGFGTIVTGTANGQPIETGAEVCLLPSLTHARIRNIQSHGEAQTKASSGHRIALNLSGVSHNEIQKGQVIISPDSIPTSAIIDIHYSHLSDAAELSDGSRVRVIIASSEYLARFYLYENSTIRGATDAFVQLRLDSWACVLPKDRVIIRRESPLETLGGGVVVDPWAQKMRSKNKVALLHCLKEIHSGKSEAALLGKGTIGLTKLQADLWGIHGFTLEGRIYAEDIISQWLKTLKEHLRSYHLKSPLSMGIPLRELHSQTLAYFTPRAFTRLIEILIDNESIVQSAHRIKMADFEVTLTPAQKEHAESLFQSALQANWEGILSPPEEGELIHYLTSTEQLIQIQGRLLHPQAVAQLVSKIVTFFTNQDRLQPSDFKDISGLSRKYAIPWLEWLDNTGVTQRTTDGRKLLRP